MNLKWMPVVLLLGMMGCTQNQESAEMKLAPTDSQLYSKVGKEHQVQFKALYQSSYRRIEDVRPNSLSYEIKRVTQFLFGPLTYRDLGGAQKGEKIQVSLEDAFLEEGRVMIPYTYQAVWMIHERALQAGSLEVPLPYSLDVLRTSNWQSCTDRSDEDHRTWGFFWYFWDPQRPGCEHQLGQQFQNVQVEIGSETEQTKISYPEYQKMIRIENGVPTLSMTFGFGYVKDVANPRPFQDFDFGMREFQRFHRTARNFLVTSGFSESQIQQSEYTAGSTVIGARFTGMKNNLRIRISIVAAAGVDQMDLFAHSYARAHEGFFGWFGHSRVGAGFDADQLKSKLLLEPEQFSISPHYQLVYWAGCNSYSYYTLPFFEMKSDLNPQSDPNGTKNLDLISNALPSLFAFNAKNAEVLLRALLRPESPTSYQSIINEIEGIAEDWNAPVIVNVLGDEDNPT